MSRDLRRVMMTLMSESNGMDLAPRCEERGGLWENFTVAVLEVVERLRSGVPLSTLYR